MSSSDMSDIENFGHEIATQFCSLPPTSIAAIIDLDFIQRTAGLVSISARRDLHNFVGRYATEKPLAQPKKREALSLYLKAIGRGFADYVNPQENPLRDTLSDSDWSLMTGVLTFEVVSSFTGFMNEAAKLVTTGSSFATAEGRKQIVHDANAQNLRNLTSRAAHGQNLRLAAVAA